MPCSVTLATLAALSLATLSAQPSDSLSSLLRVVPQHSQFPGGATDEDFELFLTNLSKKGIAAFNIQVTTPSPIGTESYAVDPDFTSSFASVGRVAPDNDARYYHAGPIRPGEQISQLLAKRYGAGIQFITHINGIVFDDNTVAGDRSWAQGVFLEHDGTAAGLDGLIARLRTPTALPLRQQIRVWRNELLAGQRRVTPSHSVEEARTQSGRNHARSLVIEKLGEMESDTESDASIRYRFENGLSLLSDLAREMHQHSRMAE